MCVELTGDTPPWDPWSRRLPRAGQEAWEERKELALLQKVMTNLFISSSTIQGRKELGTVHFQSTTECPIRAPMPFNPALPLTQSTRNTGHFLSTCTVPDPGYPANKTLPQ